MRPERFSTTIQLIDFIDVFYEKKLACRLQQPE
jgi:hypothetical protein